MKLFIEVELGPDEVVFATELFKTLRLLTDRVKTRDLKKLFSSIIAGLKDDWDLERAASEINKVLTVIDSSDSAMDEFIAAFEEIVFSREMVIRQQSLAPYMRLFPRLSERLIAKLQDVFVSKVLRNLTLKRPIDASRTEMYPYVEAFAVLVNLEFVSVSGAVKTIISMLRKPENRCAAVTMLGKTLEICLAQLTEKCDPSTLGELRASVQAVMEPNFQYDIGYIKESFGWNHPSSLLLPSTPEHSVSAPYYAAAPTLGRQSWFGLCALESFHGHRTTVFALCYDSRRNHIVSAGKDGSLISWSADGQIRSTVCVPRHYACSMDIHEASNSLFICGVAKEEAGPPPCIFRYVVSPSGWTEQNVYPKEKSKLISCVKAFPGTEAALITGETMLKETDLNSPKYEEKICYYQISPDASWKLMKMFSEHEDLITSLSLFPPNNNVFLSASRDCTVRVWDRRTDHSVGLLGTTNGGGRVQAHAAMVTSVDASDTDMIISAGMDSVIHRWDFRNLSSKNSPVSSITLDESAILKVALKEGTAAAAVSTLNGLYYADFSQPRPFIRLAEPFVDGRRTGRYHDLKWSTCHNVMYAGGDDMRIDVYGIRLE